MMTLVTTQGKDSKNYVSRALCDKEILVKLKQKIYGGLTSVIIWARVLAN